MAEYIGEYRCKLDEKGRLSLPSKMRAQLSEDNLHSLIINRGFDKCITLFTKEDWLIESKKLNAVDDYTSEEIRRFKRIITAGANLVQPDSAQRILIPKMLSEYAGLKENIVVSARGSKFEIWDAELYDAQWNVDPAEMSRLANLFQQQISKQEKE